MLVVFPQNKQRTHHMLISSFRDAGVMQVVNSVNPSFKSFMIQYLEERTLWREVLVVCDDLRINLEQVVILRVSSEEISDADDSTAKWPPVLYTAQVFLLPCSHPPCAHTQTQTHTKGATLRTMLRKPERFKKHVVLSRIKRQWCNSYLFLSCARRCRRLFANHCFPNPEKTRRESVIERHIQSL